MKQTKLLSIVVIAAMIGVTSATIVGCSKNIPVAVHNTMISKISMMSFESDDTNKITLSPAEDESIQSVMEHIDIRILGIKNNLDSFTCIDNNEELNYYDGNNLVCRWFYNCFEPESLSGAEFVFYELYYDEYNNLIFADITHYRGPAYSIYFQNNELLHVEVGAATSERTSVNGDITALEDAIREDAYLAFVLEDMAICLEHAYN